MLKKMMKMASISTEFSCRLEVLDDKFLKTCLLLVLGLDLGVELALENLLIFGTDDSLGRRRHGNQVEGAIGALHPELFSDMLQFDLYRASSSLVSL